MNIRLRKRLAAAMVALGCLLCIVLPAAQAFAENVLAPGCEGVSDAALCQGNKPQTPGSNDLYGPNGILTKVTNILANVVGIAAVIVIIIGGIRYTISSGDSNNVNGAKNAILFAIVGLIVALLAKAVVLFVLNKL